MKIAIIGGTNLMGPHLVSELLEGAHNITCLNRSGTSQKTNAIACDRKKKSEVDESINRLNPDVVIDMIPYTRDDATILSEILEDHPQTQLIAVSSIDVYLAYARIHRTEIGPYQNCPIKETDELRNEISFQGKEYDKLSIEEIYLKNLQNVSILRMPAIYGWPDTTRINEYLTAGKNKEPKLRIHPKFAQWGFSRASAQNCAHAIALTVGLTGHNIYNVAEEILLTEERWCKEVWRAMGIQGEIIYDESIKIPFDADINQEWHVDTSKIRQELGYTEKKQRIDTLKHAIEMERST